MTDLSRVKDREGLKPSREPHWNRIQPGCFLGYRPSAKKEGVGLSVDEIARTKLSFGGA